MLLIAISRELKEKQKENRISRMKLKGRKRKGKDLGQRR
jgi:hypothetical protein